MTHNLERPKAVQVWDGTGPEDRFSVRQVIALEKEEVLVKTLWAYCLDQAQWKKLFL